MIRMTMMILFSVSGTINFYLNKKKYWDSDCIAFKRTPQGLLIYHPVIYGGNSNLLL